MDDAEYCYHIGIWLFEGAASFAGRPCRSRFRCGVFRRVVGSYNASSPVYHRGGDLHIGRFTHIARLVGDHLLHGVLVCAGSLLRALRCPPRGMES